jgi:eukaryotic-like serine/threonine-protein kinase
MLTARRAFAGQSTADVVAGVLEREPDLNVVPPDTPPAIRRLLRRTLSKNPRTRLRDMGDVRLEINDAQARVEDVVLNRPRPTPAGVKMLYAATLAAVVMAAFFVSQSVRPRAVPTPISRFEIPGATTAKLDAGLAISRDGSRLVLQTGFVVRHREKGALETLDIGPAGESLWPFFSPDGRWLGYSGDGAIKKVAVTGGAPVELVKIATQGSGAWAEGHIVYADATGLYRVAQEGGQPEKLPVTLASNEQVAFPEVLPGGRAILVTVMATRTNVISGASQSRQARIDALDLGTRKQMTVLRGGGRPRYGPTGRLLFARNGTLHAVVFDASRLETRGDPIELVGEGGSSAFAVSDEGTLVHVSGGAPRGRELVWVDRRGREESLGAPLRPYVYLRLSPDGKRVALDVRDADRDIWIWDISRKVLERFTDNPAEDLLPVWSPDGRYLAFGSSRTGVSNVFRQASDRRGEPERLWESDRLQQPMSFAPDGRLQC